MADPVAALVGPGGPPAAPPSSTPGGSGLIGTPPGSPPTHYADPGQGQLASGLSGVIAQNDPSQAFNVQQNQFGSNPTAPQYHNNDEWMPASNPQLVPGLQSALVQAGLLNVKDVRIGVWDQTSANAFKTVLALANNNGGTWQDALDFLVSNPKLGTTSKTSGNPRSTTYVQNPANVRSSFQNAAESLTGGDLPASQADAFVNYFAGQEMKAAAGTLTQQAMDPTAYIQQNDQGAINQYQGVTRYLEFLRMLGVSA